MAKADPSVPSAWRQKSLDEKKLRFVMKRSSMPAQMSTSSYINHGVLANHKAATAAASPAAQLKPEVSGKGGESKAKSPVLKAQERRLYIDDFSDFDCLLEEEEREVKEDAGRRRRSSSSTRDRECQTGDELVQAMFLQLRRRRFQTSSGSNTPSPLHPTRDLGVMKEVTFSTHVVPVHVDTTCAPSRGGGRVPEHLPLFSEMVNEGSWRTRSAAGNSPLMESQRRPSDLSSLSYMDGVSSPDTPGQAPPPLRRCSDTSDVSSIHRGFHNIYHRPPTPRTPRKLLIQNNHSDITAGDGGLPREALPSPHLLHVHGGASRMATTPSSASLSSLSSQGSLTHRRNGRRRGEASEEEEEEEGGPRKDREGAEDGGVVEFQQYLHDHGLNLDMSSVQTSNL